MPFGLLCLCFEFISAAEGVKIAQEAKSWKGTSYKSPGHAKKSGADCSGSTWQIYKNAGYSYAESIIETGRFNEDSTKCKMQKVNGTPQAGDVVKFVGHMAIYDPNIGTYNWHRGKIVKEVIWTTRGTNDAPGEYSTAPIEWWGTPVYYRFCKEPCNL